MIDSITFAGLWVSVSIQNSLSFTSNFGATCQGGTFFGFPTWYKYLDGQGARSECVPVIHGITDLWLILLAVVEILIRLAAMAAIVYVIYGGFKFMTARGNPEKIASARTSVIDALVGVIIAVAAIAMINFVGGKF